MMDEQGNVCCDRCGHVMAIGEHPFCPHGLGQNAMRHDDIPGGMVLENYGPKPITVYSHTERERVMKSQGLQLKEKFCPTPGTDIDPAGIPNPKGFMDPQTLANATELICRNGVAKPEWDGVEAGVISSTFSGHLTERDAIAVASGDTRRSARLGQRLKHATHTGS